MPTRECGSVYPQTPSLRIAFGRRGMRPNTDVIRIISAYTCHQTKFGEIRSELLSSKEGHERLENVILLPGSPGEKKM
jgi:hypothetical protein